MKIWTMEESIRSGEVGLLGKIKGKSLENIHRIGNMWSVQRKAEQGHGSMYTSVLPHKAICVNSWYKQYAHDFV